MSLTDCIEADRLLEMAHEAFYEGSKNDADNRVQATKTRIGYALLHIRESLSIVMEAEARIANLRANGTLSDNDKAALSEIDDCLRRTRYELNLGC